MQLNGWIILSTRTHQQEKCNENSSLSNEEEKKLKKQFQDYFTKMFLMENCSRMDGI